MVRNYKFLKIGNIIKKYINKLELKNTSKQHGFELVLFFTSYRIYVLILI